MDLIEFQSVIGYTFKNEDLLVQSLTHPSYMIKAEAGEISNQRLEFLGDAVLELIVSEELYRVFPDVREGLLTVYRSILVRGSELVKMADKLDLSEQLRVCGADGNGSPKDQKSSKADAFEALLGAIYLDGGYSTVKDIVLGWYGDLGEELEVLNQSTNPKGKLQEKLSFLSEEQVISYVVVAESGPSHDKTFEIEMRIGEQAYGSGIGKSKKEAEEGAAAYVLEHFDSLAFPNA